MGPPGRLESGSLAVLGRGLPLRTIPLKPFSRGRWGSRLRGQNLLSGQCGQIPALETITAGGRMGGWERVEDWKVARLAIVLSTPSNFITLNGDRGVEITPPPPINRGPVLLLVHTE